MKNKTKMQQSRLEHFSSLYENAKSAYSDRLDLLERHLRQYRGDTAIDGSNEPASAIRNITYEIVESQVSSDIPSPKTDPISFSERRGRAAQSIERLLRALRDILPFEELNDLDERYTYIYGGSVWFVEWDNGIKIGNEIGGVRVHCLSPTDFIPQPSVFSVEDMEYCFLKFITTRAELCRRYGVSHEDTLLADCIHENGDFDTGDSVSVILCFYRGEGGAIGQFIFSGQLILSDIENYYSRKVRICTICGKREELCSCENPKYRTEDETLEYLPEELGGARAPYYYPTDFPIVIRKNTSIEKCLLGQSDCEYLRPNQQAINKIETRIMQKLLRAGVTPIIPEDASVTLNNSVFGQVIRMKPGDSAAQYGKVDTTPDISQDIAEAQRLYDHAKRIIGISDAYQGIGEYASESGVARQLRISQASGRLLSKRKMKNAAYARLDKLIFRHYLAFADEPRNLSYKDCYGRLHDESFNRYDFLCYDAERGEYYYDDAYLFSSDLSAGTEYGREELWRRNLENLNAGTLGDVSDPRTLLRYWQSQERAHYPNARENVEYFLELIAKGGGLGAG